MLSCCCTTVLSTIRSNELLCIHRILLLIDPRDYPSAYLDSRAVSQLELQLNWGMKFNFEITAAYPITVLSCTPSQQQRTISSSLPHNAHIPRTQPYTLSVCPFVCGRYMNDLSPQLHRTLTHNVHKASDQQTNEPESGDPRASNEPTMGRPGQRRRVWVHCASINERLLCGRALPPEMDNKPATASFGGGGTGLDWMYRMWMHVGYAELRLIIE